ncbi:hypothetical protein QJS10_CPA08g00146 [Acorus calamus]|uniref:Uncharacterized protein n=1 Tax=Acorus calamus TaxID=4465 RepID=A0AAV9EBE7_ACOCL|nr:hypothetical protein QJS10_CPA08g00146 [Acorus calamus]
MTTRQMSKATQTDPADLIEKNLPGPPTLVDSIEDGVLETLSSSSSSSTSPTATCYMVEVHDSETNGIETLTLSTTLAWRNLSKSAIPMMKTLSSAHKQLRTILLLTRRLFFIYHSSKHYTSRKEHASPWQQS